MKFLFLNKSQGYVLATLLCLVFLGACYFFIYLPVNEKRVEEQRFRTLQNVDRNIHSKIENSIALLNNLLDSYNYSSKAYLDKYTQNYARDKFILSPVSVIKIKNNKKVKDSVSNAPNLVVNDATKEIMILLQKPVTAANDTATIIQASVKFTFQQFIEYLLPDAVFDEYIVFSKGNTAYETFPSGISNAKEDSLLNIRNGIGGSFVKDITAGGKDYMLFMQPVTFDSNNKWILGGLLSKSRYLHERSQLPARLIMLMVTAVLGMIVIFPWIKLYQMGSKDRLTLADGASTIVVSMLLLSLMFFWFFKYNTRVRSTSPDSKKTLAAQISNAFFTETEKAFYALNFYNSLRVNNRIDKNIVNLNKSSVAFADTSIKKGMRLSAVDSSTRHSLDSFKTLGDVKQVFWLDSDGNQKYNWTADEMNAPFGNYKTRSYFNNIINNKAYYLNGDTLKKYYLDQVVSWNSGTFTSVLSMPASNPANYVAAIAFTMQSVQDVVLPSGYSFAVIDNKGKVLYHSLKSRNLNENVKSEFTDSSAVVGCIEAGVGGEFTTRYHSKSYAVSVTPLKGLPYFIIIFSDTDYIDIRDVEIYSFTFSMLLLLFLYIVLQLCITFLVSSRRSFFKKQQFDTSWLGPKISGHKDYILSSAVNLLVIVLLVASFKYTTFLQYLFLLLFAVTFISLFLNKLLAKRYKREGKKEDYRLKKIAVRWLSALLIIIDIAAFRLLEGSNFAWLFFIELIAIGAGIIFLKYRGKIPANVRTALSEKWNYTHSFSLMALTGLIITSGIPVAFFYITSYNYEQSLGVRHKQTEYANRLLEQPSFHMYAVSKDSVDITNKTGIYFDSTWISAMPSIVDSGRVSKNINYTVENTMTRKILSAFRLNVGDRAVKTGKFYVPYAADTSVVYQPLLIDNSAGSIIYTYRQTGISNKYVQVSSFPLSYVVPSLFKTDGSFLYWLLLAVALLVFYFVLNNIIKKLFCLNLPNLNVWQQLDQKIVVDNKLNKFLFVIGLPGAGKFKYLTDMIKNGEVKYDEEVLVYDRVNKDSNTVFVADLINIPDTGTDMSTNKGWIDFQHEVLLPKYRLIVVNHFEYNIQDTFTNLAKLNLLEELMLKSNCKIIVLSTIHPVAFLDSINENVKKADAESKNVQDLERWHVLLGHYRIVIMPILKQETISKPAWQALIRTETNYTHFLHDMQEVTLDIAKDLHEEEAVSKTDELAYKLQVTAHYFYMYIWQSLTKEEKFLLYDLAEDNLINSYDDYNLTMLIAKGLIIHSNGSLGFFNKGFRNFILTAIGNAEAMKIKDRIKENGNWSNLKTPLIIIILAILAFLLISQQEAYSKLLTYVAALSAGVPAVLKIFSLFDKNAPKTGT